MSTLSLTIYKTEANVHTNPATPAAFSTHCDGGLEGMLKKAFVEVLIRWDLGLLQWVEETVFDPGVTIVALKTTNPCDLSTAYLNYGFHDFRLKQICCVNEVPPENLFLLTEDLQVIDTETGDGILIE